MCTVTYLPLSNGEFVLTSNRDESPLRSPQTLYQSEDKTRIFPREPKAGGTWICITEEGRLVCLLNGAFEKHKHQPPYKRSRGLVVLDFFGYPNAETFFEDYDFEGIEPFTMVVCEQGKVFDFRWDEDKPHVQKLDPSGAYIWSSSPLYPADIRAKRQGWFDQWLANTTDKTRENILQFHKTAGTGDKTNDLVMERFGGALRTVSITSVLKQQDSIEMTYNDLINGNLSTKNFSLAPQV